MATLFVSVVIPCYNEVYFIKQCLNSIIDNDYPKSNLEILVIDGMSNDGTREIIQDYSNRSQSIRLVDNPDRIKPKALNIGIQESQGDIIIRMDAHSVYEPDYISKCVKYLEEYNADNVGGTRKTLPGSNTLLAKSIAHSISNPFAAGNATYRTGAKSVKWVDTVFGGCYRREIFEKIGMFDEALIRGQDREFNVRLVKNGGKILFSPDIVCHYYARSNYIDFVKWIFVGGLTPFYISKIVGNRIYSWRNLVPLAFSLSLFFTGLLSFVIPEFLYLLFAIIVFYTLGSLFFSLRVVKKERDLRFFPLMFFIFLSTHIPYGLGSLLGIVKPVDKKEIWSKV